MNLFYRLLFLISEIDFMIELSFELAINLIEIFICTEFITRYLGFKDNVKYGKIGFLCTWFLGFVEVCIINYITFFETFATYIPILIYFIYALIFLKGKVLLKLWAAALTQVQVMLIAVVTNLFVCIVIGYDPYLMITVFNSTRVITVLATKVILLLTTRLMLRYKYISSIDNHSLVVLILIPLLSVMSITQLMVPAFDNPEIRIYLLLGMTSIVMANVFAYCFFVKTNKQYERSLKFEIQKQNYEQQISSQSKHVDEILVMQKQIKKFRHDSSHHFTALKGFFANNQNQDGLTYIEKINSDLENTEIVDTGNTAFDAIISTKKALAESKNIEFTIQIQIPEKLKVDAVDLCVIFGNSLDNAIEACEKLENQRMINVSAIYDDCQLICKITNTAALSTTDLQTTKTDKENHGFGLDNIKQALSKYNHVLKIDQTDNEFVLSFIIFNC